MIIRAVGAALTLICVAPLVPPVLMTGMMTGMMTGPSTGTLMIVVPPALLLLLEILTCWTEVNGTEEGRNVLRIEVSPCAIIPGMSVSDTLSLNSTFARRALTR